MLGEKNVLNYVLRNYVNVNGRSADWIEAIRSFVAKDPQREAQFKSELDAAVEHDALSAKEYEDLTDEDFDSQEDLVEWLQDLRGQIYPS